MRSLQKVLILVGTVTIFNIASTFASEEVMTAETYDNYTKTTGIATDKFNVPGIDSFFAPAYAFATLRGAASDDHMESMELLMHYSGTDWKFFSSALDSEGNALQVHEIDRQIQSSSNITEDFMVSLTRPYLEAHKDSGLNIRFAGKYGRLVVQLPAKYVIAFLTRLNQVEASITARLAGATNPSTPLASKPEKLKLGVNYVPVDAAFAKVTAMTIPKGVSIVKVVDDSVANHAGILVGDAVLTVNNVQVQSSMTGLLDAIANIQPGTLATMTIWRNAKEITLPVQF